jgi:hypothetical protein
MNDDPLFAISKSGIDGAKQTLHIYNWLDKIESQVFMHVLIRC